MRNKWGGETDMHHYYGDWGDENLEQVDISDLLKIYNELFHNYLSKYNIRSKFSYKLDVANITVSDGSKHMATHNHYAEGDDGSVVLFSMIHYVKFNKQHKTTTFENPLLLGKYINTILKPNKLFYPDLTSMAYMQIFEIETEEDDVVFFPSYIDHCVKANAKTDELRITSVCNVSIKLNE
jgi:hypothetical protein